MRMGMMWIIPRHYSSIQRKTHIMLYLLPQSHQPEAPAKAEKSHLATVRKARQAKRQRPFSLLRGLLMGSHR